MIGVDLPQIILMPIYSLPHVIWDNQYYLINNIAALTIIKATTIQLNSLLEILLKIHIPKEVPSNIAGIAIKASTPKPRVTSPAIRELMTR